MSTESKKEEKEKKKEKSKPKAKSEKKKTSVNELFEKSPEKEKEFEDELLSSPQEVKETRKKDDEETSTVRWLREAPEKEISDSPVLSENSLEERDVSMLFGMGSEEAEEEKIRRRNEKLPPIAPTYHQGGTPSFFGPWIFLYRI